MTPTVNRERLWTRLQQLAAIGTNGGRRHRRPYGADHVEAVALVASWLREAGADPFLEESATLVGLLQGGDTSAPAVGLGSHLDTVPDAGAFDGALGVVAAVEVLQTLREHGVTPPRSIAALAFADEEGNDLGIGVLSAQLWTGAIRVERWDEIRDGEGRSLASLLDAFDVPGVPRRSRPALAAYLELHVEQGPTLDRDHVPAAAVEGIVGIERTTVVFTGAANHAGTTPMALRRDALWGGADLAVAVRAMAVETGERAVATVGVFEVCPGATNVVPGQVRLRVEMRSLDAALLARLRSQVEARARQAASRFGLEVALDPWHLSPPVEMHPSAFAATRDALVDAGLPVRSMPSWAGHDAKVLAAAVPTGMLFVPSRGGISHAPGEYTDPQSCADGTQALLYAALRMAASDVLG